MTALPSKLPPGADTWTEKSWKPFQKGEFWEEWHAPACDPTTPAAMLQTIASEFLPREIRDDYSPHDPFRAHPSYGGCILEAIAAHPNAPPLLLAQILSYAPVTGHAFCQNPIAPLLLLEMPDFLAALTHEGQLALLREAAAPPALARLLSQPGVAKSEAVKGAAQEHLAFAGEVAPGQDWQSMVRDYWKATQAQDADLVEMGFAPSWAKGGAVNKATGSYPGKWQAEHFAYLDVWFDDTPGEGSLEEADMVKQIAPGIDGEVAARGLRLHATTDDLVRLVRAVANTKRGLVRQAILRHPSLNDEVLYAIGQVKDWVSEYDLAFHKLAGPHVLRDLLQKGDSTIRCLARRHPNAPPDALDISRATFLAQVKLGRYTENSFTSFVTTVHLGHLRPADAVAEKAESLHWTERMEAALIAGQNPGSLDGDFAGRTASDLLHHLAHHDGSRLVRAAARTYLATPDYRFVL